MLCKCSGKYIDIYFILRITYFSKYTYNSDIVNMTNCSVTYIVGICNGIGSIDLGRAVG